MSNKFLHYTNIESGKETGLGKLLSLFKGLYDSIFNSVKVAKEDPRIFNIDYSELEFDTTKLVEEEVSLNG